jgi:HD-GYP domain-containing protein (c-di-GMP phosphodiesterase class II)
MAQTLKYDLENQLQVGLSGLLHEIGVARLPKRVLHQPTPMRSEMRHRPAYGAELLHEFNPECDWLIETVGQVYEREDGSGFPLGLKGRDIREEAKILGIVDVFEASVHDRPYRKALTGYQLLEGLTLGVTTGFSDHVVKALIESFSVYPYNEYVVLNSDEVGQVVEVNPRNSWRPIVKILFDKDGVPLDEPKETDLAQASSLFITKAITYHELPDAD